MKKIATLLMGILLVGATMAQAAGRPFVTEGEEQITAAGAFGHGDTCIGKAQAEQDALNAVGGGTVLRAVFEGQDKPPHWSVDIRQSGNVEYEVWVSCSGKILKIIKG